MTRGFLAELIWPTDCDVCALAALNCNPVLTLENCVWLKTLYASVRNWIR